MLNVVCIKRIIHRTFLSFVIAVIFCSTVGYVAHAQDSVYSSPIMRGLAYIQAYSGLPNTNLPLVIAKLVRLALSFVGIILVLIIIYSGLLWMTSGGDEEKLHKRNGLFIVELSVLLLL
jgi:hypothetical protein